MKNRALIFSTGMAMFSMFFGSGNLVFPIVVGQLSQGHFFTAFLGILLTGVLVPFLGILGMFLFNGNSNDFFARLGKPVIFWFSLFALAIMGPFGVLARCITVAHGAYRLIHPEMPLWIFSIAFCFVIFFLTVRKNKIVPLLGAVLTPFLLLSLSLIAFFGVSHHSLSEVQVSGTMFSSFTTGILQGYQTMDLLAAFFFSAFVIKHLQNHKAIAEKPENSLPIFLKSSLVGATLLALIYGALVVLGALYAPTLATIPPQEMLGVIAEQALGSLAAPIVCIAVVLACLTTAIVLASLFADFLRKEVAGDKIPSILSLSTTLAIAFAISTLEFSGIARFIGPLLELTYPALIILTLLNIFYKVFGWKTIRMPIAVALLAKIITIAI